MRKKLLIVLGIVAGLITVFLIVVALQPSDFRVTRSAKMAAPPAEPFAQVNDFHNWDAWSPGDKIDPAMKRTYAGPSAGVGAVYSWVGNQDVGEGRMTITESREPELIQIKLEFLKPMEGLCPTEFTFKPDGEQTLVTWTMSGKHNFIAKAMCLFMNMDKMIGDEFEKGLANMKKVVEAPAKE